MISAYQVLGVEKNTSPEDLRRAFRKRLPLFHPDYRGSEATRDYLDFRRAYDVLRDQERRERMGDLPLFGDHLRFQRNEVQPGLQQLFENLNSLNDLKKGSQG